MKKLSRKIATGFGILLLTVFFTACGNNNETIDHATELGMHLDSGEKWIANAETTTAINRMSGQLEEFGASNNPSVADYNEVAHMLGETMSELVDQCSMEGDAHAQLHVFIMPIFEYINTMKTDDLANCKQAGADLTEHLKIYDNYFTLEM